MKITRNSTKLTTTTTLSTMLMMALVFCSDPVDPMALIARIKAGMMHMRQKRDVPQQITVRMENTRAHIAKPFCCCSGGDTYVVVAAVG